MSFSDEILENASERYMLVQVSPRKFLGVGTLISPNTYTFVTGLPRVDAVQVNGTNLSPGAFSQTNGVLTVVSTDNLASSSNYVTADSNVYMTSVKQRDTTDGAGGLPFEVWEPLLLSNPKWSQSMRNIMDGIFTISNTQLELIPEDRWVQNSLGSVYSWSKAVVKVWVCVGHHSNNRLVFNGYVTDLNLTQDRITVGVASSFEQLKASALFGSKAQAYATNGNSPYSTYVPKDREGDAIPLVLGRRSPVKINLGPRHSGLLYESGDPTASTNFYYCSDGIEPIPVTDRYETATSVTYLLGRIIGTDVKRLTFGTISRAYKHVISKRMVFADNSGGAYSNNVTRDVHYLLYYMQCSNCNAEIGDYVPGYGFVCKNDGSFSYGGNSYNLVIVSVDYVFDITPTSGSISPSLSDNVYPSASMWVDGKGEAVYTWNGTDPFYLTGGNVIASYPGFYAPFTLSLGTPYSFAGQTITHVYATVDYADINFKLPGTYNFRCRFTPATNLSHGECMKFIMKACDLDVNATSFTTADSDFVENVCFSSPRFGDRQFPTYLSLAESVAKSCFAMVRMNTDNEVEYQVISDPEVLTADFTRDPSNLLDGQTSVSINYQDIYDIVVFKNENYDGPDATDRTISSNYIRSLHRSYRSTTFDHVLEDITARDTIIAGYLGNPRIEYALTTSSEDLETEIGDTVALENTLVANEDGERNVMVTEVNAGSSSTTILAQEVRLS